MYITMIGISGSGKTSYMAGLYESLGVETFQGFRIESTIINSEVDDLPEVLEVGNFDSISFSNHKGFPPGTQKTTLWSFNLFHHQDKIARFHWIDYRGGILTDPRKDFNNNEEKMDELREVNTHIHFSNAVMIFIDSIILTKYENISKARRESGVDMITNLLLKIDSTTPNKNLTYMIVLTKSDAIDDEWKNNDYKKLLELGELAFKKFIEYARKKPNWVGGIVPITSVGDGKAKTEINLPENWYSPMEVKNTMIDFPKPKYVRDALFFVLGQTLKRNLEYSQLEISKQQKEKIEMLKKSNIAYRIFAYITSKPDPRGIIMTLEEQQEAIRANLQQYEKFIDPLLSIAYKSVKLIH